MKILFLLVCFMLPLTAHAQQKLTWCAYYNWAPWIYPAGDSYDGILIEELNLLQKKYNIKAEAVVRDNWRRCQADVESGKIDIILGANKTPEREIKFHYLSVPAFINKSMISAYTVEDNTQVQPVKSLQELKQYKLVMTRGNSFGTTIDDFINSIDEPSRGVVRMHDQALKMLAAKRRDYIFSADSSFDSMIQKFAAENPAMKGVKYRKIFSMERATPAYIAVTKKGQKFNQLSELWINTINNYNDSVNIEERINYHKQNAKKFAE
ncbi:substrate-binding periplasmic protein [Psychromonas aquimarina]|uniref:substrate-binding periplasmic protein n=1 Tax=Psychromonas aquimarina TaxID=444919 RepID=UPI0004268EFE|nr:transporter substrate-binding domain-containing protein [Psychromonas aquimarina]